MTGTACPNVWCPPTPGATAPVIAGCFPQLRGKDQAWQVVQLELEGISPGAIAIARGPGHNGDGGNQLLFVLGRALPDDGVKLEIPPNEQVVQDHLA